jgi:hypothetical protein
MSEIVIRFACGHVQTFPPGQDAAPICPQCRETRVQSVSAPPPTFRGACAGPRKKE